jgi:hypothetical protein
MTRRRRSGVTTTKRSKCREPPVQATLVM